MFERISVLVVDDNRNMRTILRTILRGFTFQSIHEASDAVEAFELMRTVPTDLLITDLAMQPINGLEFAKMVRTAADSPHPHVPIILVTGYASKVNIFAARDAGIDEILAKPVTASAIYDRIRRITLGTRNFVRTGSYFGPDRRRFRGLEPPPGTRKRRQSDQSA